jgi:hypothetical protein
MSIRNINLVYRRRHMVPDYQQITAKIRALSDRTLVHIVPDNMLDSRIMSRLNQWPSISFSPSLLLAFSPPRGPLYSGKVLPKSEQMTLMAKSGVRTPKWAFLAPDKAFDEAVWGKAVIVKPNVFGWSSGGAGIELVRTDAVRYIPREAYPPEHPGRQGDMLVQQFIDSGEHSEDYRVVTMFGHPLYALKRKSLVRMANIFDGVIERTTAGVVSNAGAREAREVHLCYEQPVLKFASLAYLAIPQVPFQAVDIRRDINTGHLYCLEINPGGFTWNFSSKRARQTPTIDGVRREDQFGAWEIAAKALVSMAESQAA